MHPVTWQHSHPKDRVKNLQKENAPLDSTELPAFKKARTECHIPGLLLRDSVGSLTESEGQSGTAASAQTPYKLDSSGWIQLETPSPNLAAQANQTLSWPSERMHSQQAAPTKTLPFPGDLKGSKTHDRPTRAIPAPFEKGFFHSPAAVSISPHDFSTEDVKKELSRLQALSQSLHSSPAADFIASDQSCRQLTWPDPSHLESVPGSRNQDVTNTESSSAAQQSLEARTSSQVEGICKATFQLAPGFTKAADIKNVERQQRVKPKSGLKRKLLEWDIPPRVAAVSS